MKNTERNDEENNQQKRTVCVCVKEEERTVSKEKTENQERKPDMGKSDIYNGTFRHSLCRVKIFEKRSKGVRCFFHDKITMCETIIVGPGSFIVDGVFTEQ